MNQTTSLQERARRYALKMPRSIQGSGGSVDAFNVAAVLVVDFDLSDEDAYSIMAEWNAECQPPWSEKELRQKIKSARRDCKRPVGNKLGDHRPPPDIPRPPSTFTAGTLTKSEAEVFAARRNISLDAINAGINLGLLRAGEHSRFGRCVAMTEDGWWQARPIYAPIFPNGKKTDSKPGSAPKFFGTSRLGDCPNVLLVEGCAGWLEAVTVILGTGHTNYAALAAYSAGSSFKDDLSLVAKLVGRRVIICPDSGKSGRDAAKRWLVELKDIGCTVDLVMMQGYSDLGNFLTDPVAIPFMNNELRILTPIPTL
jgi:hypothetical protein